jgi:hypothetical protein
MSWPHNMEKAERSRSRNLRRRAARSRSLVRLIAGDDRLRAEADEDVVWVFQRVAKTAIPGVPALAQVTLKKPARPLGFERLDGSTPAHAHMVDEAAPAIKVDDADRAARLALDAPRKGVVAARADDPNGTVLPQKPDRRLARAFFGSGGEVCEERTREELFEVDGAWPVVNELHHRREIVGPKSRPAAEHSSGERRTQGSITKVGTGTWRSLAASPPGREVGYHACHVPGALGASAAVPVTPAAGTPKRARVPSAERGSRSKDRAHSPKGPVRLSNVRTRP